MSRVSWRSMEAVALIGVGVFEILIGEKRERQNGSEARESLVVKTLASKLILRARGSAGCAVNAGNGAREVTDDHRALENLRRVKKRCRAPDC